MAKTAQEFLDLLVGQHLVPPEVLESLRKQVAKAARPVSPGTLARLLVDHGHLTEAQGERLAGMSLPASKKSASHSGVLGLEPIGAPQPAAPKTVAKSPAKSQAEIDAAAAALGLAPIHEAPKPAPKSTPAKPMTKPAATASASTIAKAKPLPTAAPLLEGLEALSPLPGDDLFGATAADPFAAADPFSAAPVAAKASAAPLAADPLAAAVPLTAPQPKVAKPVAARRPRSKLLPIIGIAVVVLFVVGSVAGFLLTRSNGDEEFMLAEQDYQAKQYDAAAAKLSTFLEDFPANSQAGTARVHRSMAKILAASPAKDNHAAMLIAAKASLPEIGGEPGLAQAHSELAPLLTDIAANLAEQARQGKTAAESADKLAQAKDALALANDGRFVPGTLRQWQRLADVEESLALLDRDLGRAKALEGGLEDIKKNASGGKLAEALVARRQLLLSYPELAGDVTLRDLGRQIAPGVAATVKTAADASKGVSTEAKPGVLAAVTFAGGNPPTAAETPETTFFALAEGLVWALDGGSGKLLWSRPVGRNAGSGATPLSLEPNSDVVLADFHRNEVLCLHPRSGAMRWRHEFKEPLTGDPLVLNGKVIVATRGGKLFTLDPTTGNGKSAAQLPQAFRLGPISDATGQHIYQVAEDSFLYVLSADLKCEAAVYLGHEPGSVDSPPIVLAKHLVIAEIRAASSLLHVVPLNDKGLSAGPSQQVEVSGLVTTAPVLLSERLVVLTDQQAVAFDYQPDEAEALKKLGESDSGGLVTMARHGVVTAGKLWTAADGLHRFDFLPAGGTLKESWAGFAGETLDALPQAAGDMVFCVRRLANQPGVIATAVKAASGETLWETHLAQSLISVHVAAGGESATVTNASGAETKLDLAALSGSSVQFIATSLESKPLSGSLDAPLAAPPLAWAGGRLCITTSGSVHLLNAQSAAPLAEPFQLSLRIGSPLDHCSAAPVDGESIVIQNGPSTLYHLRLEKAPQPRLVLAAKAALKSPAISRVCVLESSAYVVDSSGALHVLSLPDLKSTKTIKMGCRAVLQGPEPVGKHILLATDAGDLVCLDSAGKQLWKIALVDGPLAGHPVEVGGDIVLALKRGLLLRVAAASGKEIARADLSQSLSGDAAVAGSTLLMPTAAGGILKVVFPEKK
jgi:outer membrane protein assembly factor BamB